MFLMQQRPVYLVDYHVYRAPDRYASSAAAVVVVGRSWLAVVMLLDDAVARLMCQWCLYMEQLAPLVLAHDEAAFEGYEQASK
jgi:hypothetical protein